MKPGFWAYVRAAFSARPIGMFVPPNWIGVAGFAMLGFVNPGFWAIGAGLELAYLSSLAFNKRFQRTVNVKHLDLSRKEGQARIDSALAELADEDRYRYRELEKQCQAVLKQQQGSDASMEFSGQGEGLGRLLWVYLRLLHMRQSIRRTMDELLKSEMREDANALRRRRSGPSEDPGCEILEGRIRALEEKIAGTGVGEELKQSLSSQVEILQQRLKNRKDALEKLDFLEAELTRIQEQAKLIREQAAVAADPAAVLARIDQIGATLSGTTQWVREQQRVYGVADLLEEPPPVTAGPRREGKKETQ